MACSRSASSAMIAPELEPSSKVTFFIPDSRLIRSPTGGLPVKVIIRTRPSLMSRSPTVDPGPTTIFNTPAGRPASRSSSPSRRAVSGVAEAGFSTTVFPAASAGASLWATKFRGKLNGEMAAITPRGWRIKKPFLLSDPRAASMAIVSPWTLSASPAANSKVSPARPASPRA